MTFRARSCAVLESSAWAEEANQHTARGMPVGEALHHAAHAPHGGCAQPPTAEPAAPLPPPKPEPPKLGFLSAIRESLRQLEESTGYATPARPQAPPLNPGATAPTTTTCGSQLPSPLPQHLAPQHTGSSTATATTTATTTTTPGGTRIVYYVEPPPEVSYQMHHLAHHHPQQAGVEDSQPSSSSTATTPVAGAGSGASADWMTRLGWGGPHAKPPPRDGLSLPDTPDGAAAERASLYPDTGGGLSVSGGGGQAHRLGEPATSVFREGLRLSASGLPGTAAAPPAQAPQAPAPHQPAGPGPAAAAAASAGTPAKPAGAVSGGGAGDWFSSLFKGVSRATTALQYPGGEAASGGAAAAAPQSAAAYNERTFDIHAGLLQPAAAADQQQQANGSYYRCACQVLGGWCVCVWGGGRRVPGLVQVHRAWRGQLPVSFTPLPSPFTNREAEAGAALCVDGAAEGCAPAAAKGDAPPSMPAAGAKACMGRLRCGGPLCGPVRGLPPLVRQRTGRVGARRGAPLLSAAFLLARLCCEWPACGGRARVPLALGPVCDPRRFLWPVGAARRPWAAAAGW